MLEHVHTIRSPGHCGGRTHDDLRSHDDERLEAFSLDEYITPVEAALDDVTGDAPEQVELAELTERTPTHTEDGAPIPSVVKSLEWMLSTCYAHSATRIQVTPDRRSSDGVSWPTLEDA